MCLSMQVMQETQVRFLGGEDPLEKEKATRSSIPAWRMSWTEEPGGPPSMGLPRDGHGTTEPLSARAQSCFTMLPELPACLKRVS